MKKFLRFCVVGGDLRQIYTANSLVDSDYVVNIFGFDEKFKSKLSDKVKFSNDLKNSIELSDVIILPLPYSSDFKLIKSSLFSEKIFVNELMGFTRRGQFLFAGKIDEKFKKMLVNNDLNFYDYFAREEFAILNGILAAEGALAIAINETIHTIHESNALVLGYGRIGKILSNRLRDFGANVTVVARSFEDLAWVSANGIKGKSFEEVFSEIGEFDIFLNTIPSKILTEKYLDKVNKDSLIIDLASKPGGVDFKYAEAIGLNVHWALSLPGKIAPKTAGKIIKDAVLNILKEESHIFYF
ncbi:MAG: dipicolinate synthase subunit DpsA [Clostridiales bacterium]|nr:dipicolinate synthase subunit DpsA [Clostridiales bacterium]